MTLFSSDKFPVKLIIEIYDFALCIAIYEKKFYF